MNRERHRASPTGLLALALALATLVCACAPSSRGPGERGPSARTRSAVKKGTITEVLAARTPELMAIPGVIGTGEGSEQGERVFVVFVDKLTPELDARIPRELDGYAVVVRETGEVSAPPR